MEKSGTSTFNLRTMPVKNAGLVLLNSYMPVLFERVGLLADKTFLNAAAQQKAVHYLQYVISGNDSSDEKLLALSKVLCGLIINEPIIEKITIPESHIDLIEGLLSAAINYWPAIGTSSIMSFRGNWLERDGLLLEQEDKWELTVEKRTYDLLIRKSPFSFSIIKHSWMDRPLHVNWEY